MTDGCVTQARLCSTKPDIDHKNSDENTATYENGKIKTEDIDTTTTNGKNTSVYGIHIYFK